jgi:hypothetical protein
LLSSGLAHPAKILPKLLALEVDNGPGGTAEAAKGEVSTQALEPAGGWRVGAELLA